MPFYHNDQGRKIFIINSRPRNLSKGGYIHDHPAIPKKDAFEDTIMADLEDGSLVIPRPVAWMMKHYQGKIKGSHTTDKKKLVPTVVMAHEIVVDEAEAPKVERWLKKHGIELPVPQGWDLTKKMVPNRKCGGKVCSLCRRSI
jgi:hypothetical protein